MANAVLLEARPYRPFKSSEEYLYAMREDLAEWLNTLYPELRINTENFMDRLDTGVALCKVCAQLYSISIIYCCFMFVLASGHANIILNPTIYIYNLFGSCTFCAFIYLTQFTGDHCIAILSYFIRSDV